MKFLVGIDDTDTLESRGTGFHARLMASEIEANNLGAVHGITRHQNYVHPDIRYTSQNSSACLVVESVNLEGLKIFCKDFLTRIAPEGSDVGLCISQETDVCNEIVSWGYRAKNEVLKQEDAFSLARWHNIYLEGLTGTHDGIIGALAAIGLRKDGNDGRFIWLRKKKELRELEVGQVTTQILFDDFGVEQVLDINNEKIATNEPVFIHEWFRPVLKENKVTLITERIYENGKYYWQAANKEYIRSHS
nr:ABC transporter substrate-binding protein [Bacteroidota bacterium]